MLQEDSPHSEGLQYVKGALSLESALLLLLLMSASVQADCITGAYMKLAPELSPILALIRPTDAVASFLLNILEFVFPSFD